MSFIQLKGYFRDFQSFTWKPPWNCCKASSSGFACRYLGFLCPHTETDCFSCRFDIKSNLSPHKQRTPTWILTGSYLDDAALQSSGISQTCLFLSTLAFFFFNWLSLISCAFFFMLATSFECADWELRDLSSPFVPRCSGKLLPSGREKSPRLTLLSKPLKMLWSYSFHMLCSLTFYDSAGERHYPTPRGSQSWANPASGVACCVRCRSWSTWHQWAHANGLR